VSDRAKKPQQLLNEESMLYFKKTTTLQCTTTLPKRSRPPFPSSFPPRFCPTRDRATLPPTQKHPLPPLSPNRSPLPRKPSTIQRPPSPALTTSPLTRRQPQGPQHHISTGTKHTSTPSSPVPPHASDAGDGSLRLASALPRNSGSAKGQAKVSSACEVAGPQEGIVFCTPCHCVWWFDRGDVKGHDVSRTTTSLFPIGRPSKICLRVKVDAGGGQAFGRVLGSMGQLKVRS
jgi:hypothetical protein